MKTNIRKVKEIKYIYNAIQEDIAYKLQNNKDFNLEEDMGILKGLRIALGDEWRQ